MATGFAVRRRALADGVRALERMGFRPVLGAAVRERDGYLAGSDERRAADLAAMIDDPAVRAIWFARGGYGTARILDRVPWKRLARRPKTLIGYSDLTALFCAAASRTRAACLYGPGVSELGNRDSFHARSLRTLLEGREIEMPVGPGRVLVPGRARGPLAGGNLSALTSLLGTPFQPVLRGRILLLEDVGEPAYRLDRMLTQLRLAGAFEGLAGVLLGGFDPAPRLRFPPDRPAAEIVRENFAGLGVPVVARLPVGHVPRKWTVPLTGEAEIDTRRRRLRLRP